MSQTVIIGGSTTASLAGAACVLSAQWGYNPGKQDAYCLGDWVPSSTYTIYKPTETLSITVYAPTTGSYDCSPTENCTSPTSTLAASVDPEGCGGTTTGVDGNWHVTGYSYTKDSTATPGQESWSLTKYLGVAGATQDPSHVIRGISQGQSDGDTGITFNSSVTTVVASSGSVSAGGFGKANTLEHGQVASVGGGMGAGTTLGTGSVSIPYTPMYLS